MRVPNANLFDQRTIMDSDFSPGKASGSCSADLDFGFAFNDSNFSDRVLRIEIMPDLPENKSDGDGCSSIADWARNRKRRREDFKKETDVVVRCEEQILNCNMPDTVDGVTYENQDEEAVAMVEESPSIGLNSNKIGNDATLRDDSSWNMDCSTVLRVKTIHISSPILAAKSPFFYKLFSNGMRESEQRHITLRIHASEETALLDLLNFMYNNTLSTTTPTALLDVLMAADKFEVASCMRYCSRLLRNLPMTCESALLYLDLPSSVLMADAVQPLTDAAKQFLAVRYKDVTKFQEEVLNLPLAGMEAVFSSDDLQVASEDAVYDFVLKWARTHYPKIEERREVLATRLGRLIRFPYMTSRKLKKVLTCSDFDTELASKVVLEALFFKAETPYRQRALASEEANATHRRFVERAYKYRPVKIVEFELPRQQCVVYLDLKREECVHLFPAGRVYSQAFHLGGQGFFLSAHCNMDQQSSFHCFGLFLGMQEKGSVKFAVDYEFAARSRPTEDYVSKYKGNYTFTGGKAVGYRNLFGIPWTAFMADDSIYFINGILHLRAELTIRQ
ncbi:BTB/POZ domain-containing protein POB1-like isoform X1 [Durio zibethinus]|uniref:BTB/POZ domain-containing protein POB1-like isoform X1 n=2 Tax=Durio zibethinus TaxID=66656 RepID=A0A6P5Y8J3_DURZI|nr:BTB/POZ domain-containing protein POB1-like isoform X1 [Durio zibethinus]